MSRFVRCRSRRLSWRSRRTHNRGMMMRTSPTAFSTSGLLRNSHESSTQLILLIEVGLLALAQRRR